MIYLKDNAIGVDKKINFCMQKINSLNTVKDWNIDIFHRIYRERREDVYLPYRFVSGKEYKEAFLNDKTNGEVGFYLNNNRTTEGIAEVDCDIIFSLNLDKLDNGSLQREDERAIMMAFEAVEGFTKVLEVKTELRNVFSEFDTERIKFRDMQPFLNFSFLVNFNYVNNNCYGM